VAGPVADANEKPMSGPIHMDAGRPGQPRWLTCGVLAAAIAAPGLVLAQKEIPVSGSPAVEKPVKDREVARASTWYAAEGYHQDYLQRNPGGYTCHYLRSW
jgi:hypothetical protein